MKKVLLSLSLLLAIVFSANGQSIQSVVSGTAVVNDQVTYKLYLLPGFAEADWSGLSITSSSNATLSSITPNTGLCSTSATTSCEGILVLDITGTPYAIDFELEFAGNTYVGSATGVALPIELTSFEGKVQDDAVNLKWQTASEFNNDFFTIERSYDGERFEAINEIDGAGDSYETVDYNFVDRSAIANATSNVAYYRLMQTDYDGTSTYSEIVTVQIVSKEIFNIHNIQNEGANVQVYFDNVNEGNVTATIYDINGQQVSQTFISAQKGYNSINLNATQLNRGFYIINLTNGNQQVSKKFIF